VNAAAVHQDDHLAPEMTQQGAKKDGDLDRGDVVVGMHVQVEPHPVALGTDGDGRRSRRSCRVRSGAGRSAAAREVPTSAGGSGSTGIRTLRQNPDGALSRWAFFLSWSSDTVSSGRWRPHRARSARRSGFWHDQFRAVSTRPTCARWRDTPNSRWMTRAMRRVVQRSVSKPHAEAPRSKRWGSFARCRVVNFGGRPEAGFAFKAVRPRRRTASLQRMTELCEHPSRPATSVIEAPAFTRSIARRRRRSSSSGLPAGLIPEG